MIVAEFAGGGTLDGAVLELDRETAPATYRHGDDAYFRDGFVYGQDGTRVYRYEYEGDSEDKAAG